MTTLREIEKLIRDHKQLREREIKKGEIIVKAGTVSAIIKQCEQQEQLQEYADGGFEFYLIRELAVMLKREVG